MTFGLALFFGTVFVIIANKMRIPSIVVLLIGGIALGPLGLHLIDPQDLGIGLKTIIQLAVALILFEGGMTLDFKEYKLISSEIRRVLSIGVLVTWGVSSLVVRFLFGFSWSFSLLASSLIIVTGPTVISSLLKRLHLRKNLRTFLYWEAILIDPIGVFIALLCYEWLIGKNALPFFFLRVVTGTVVGFLSGFILINIIKRRWVSDEILNVFILSSVGVIYIISNLVISESGLMSVVISGFVIAYRDDPKIDEVKTYKAQLIEMLIGLLFVLLAANLDLKTFKELYGIKMIIAVAAIMVIVRPLSIGLSTLGGGNLSLKEKLFLCWLAPRGIVAASMASLFTLSLKSRGLGHQFDHIEFLEGFTYAVICGTVIVQGLSARWVGSALNVLEPIPDGWMIVGAHNVARITGKFLQKYGLNHVLVDTNIHAVKVAKRCGTDAISANALTVAIDRYPQFYGIGNVLAVTKNEELNELACQRWGRELKRPHLYKWYSPVNSGMIDGIDPSRRVGRRIWSGVPLDKLISSFDDDVSVPIKELELEAETLRHPERVLLFWQNGRMLPFVPEGSQGICTCLIYYPLSMDLDFNISPHWIIYSNAGSLSEALGEMLDHLRGDFPSLSIEAIHAQLMAQEKDYPSVIGHNISLPHAYVDNIESSIVVMAKLHTPVTGVHNEESVSIIFLVLSPKNQPNTHINTLSKISKFIVMDETRYALVSAKSKRDLVRVFFPGFSL
jgi:NhaP-type Na+/H+ or K+/H+ antiporter/mannitol/fructose-specific phosphotransferase system IIA component (Ntr-type)